MNLRYAFRRSPHSLFNLHTITFLLTLVLMSALLCVRFVRVSSAATLPTGFVEAQVATGLGSATAFAIAPDGRIFVCLQGGQLRVIKNGALLATPFVTLSVDSNGERGLLGVAFDPNFASNNFVYLYYTVPSAPIHNRVSRFTANGDVAAAGSETILLELDNLSGATNHNGGALHFGPDGKLYIAVGDNANPSNAQSFNNRLGKILRLNANGTIPTDNPFYNTASGANRTVWALGLRNPYTFNFQPGTGRMFINDVGQNTWEEINDGIAGSNYGWPTCEGSCNPANANFRDPLYQYAHSGGGITGCAITGGTFYNPTSNNFPAQYVGKYFFADYCSGWIKTYDPTNGNVANFASGISAPVDLQVSVDGSLYYLERGNSRLMKVDYGNSPPTITQQPANRTASVGQTATFTVAATGTPPLSYQWRRNGANISGANAASYTTPALTLADNGARFSVYISNSLGNTTSNEAVLTVVQNQNPTATITAPAVGTLYSGGQTINYAGTGTDPEQGTLPASAFTWEVVFHHDTHTHPFIQPFSGATSGSFTIPTTGETAANVWYRIYLTVTDASGAQHSVYRDIFPRTVTLTLASNPSGLQVTLDGQPVTTPISVTGVVGIQRQLGATSPQTLGGVSYKFGSWSDGGAQTHTITTPAVDTTYRANFNGGLQFYPLPAPLRLLDTRPGFPACYMPGAALTAGETRTQTARGTCAGLTIPNTALALVGNATVVATVGGNGGYVTLYSSDAALPNASNLNFSAGQIVPNAFTVALGTDGAFKITTSGATHFIVDVTGYYAPPDTGGLYFHPLPAPVRLLDTRPGFPACDAPGQPLQANVERAETGRNTCTIPSTAQALVGNATVVNTLSNAIDGYARLWPSGQPMPEVSNLNFTAGQVIPNAFTVGLGTDGKFKLQSTATTHVLVDVTGYFSNTAAADANGVAGLLFTPLSNPVRLLETRPGGFGCDTPGVALTGSSERIVVARTACTGVPAAAQVVVGNATVVSASQDGFATLWPSGTARPEVSNLNYLVGQVVPNAFTVRLGTSDGAFKIYVTGTTHFLVDVGGYFAP